MVCALPLTPPAQGGAGRSIRLLLNQNPTSFAVCRLTGSRGINTRYYPFFNEQYRGQVRSTRNRRACMIRCMNVDEARGVCKDRSRWRSVVSAYPHGKKA